MINEIKGLPNLIVLGTAIGIPLGAVVGFLIQDWNAIWVIWALCLFNILLVGDWAK